MTAEARRALVEAPFPIVHWETSRRWAGIRRRRTQHQQEGHEPIYRTAVNPTYYAEDEGEWAGSERYSANPWFSRRSFTVYARDFDDAA